MGACAGRGNQTYESNPRIVAKQLEQPSGYAPKLEQIIDEVAGFEQQIIQSLTPDEKIFEKYLIDRIDKWFVEHEDKKLLNMKNLKLDFLERKPNKKKKKVKIESDLHNVESMCNMLIKFEETFRIGENLTHIAEEVLKYPKLKKREYFGLTIRKELPEPKLLLETPAAIGIFKRLIGTYYLQLLRKQLASDNQQIVNQLTDFHNHIGVRFIQFVKYQRIPNQSYSFILLHLMKINCEKVKKSAKDVKQDKNQQGNSDNPQGTQNNNNDARAQVIKENLYKIKDCLKEKFYEEEYTYRLEEHLVVDMRHVTRSYLTDLYPKAIAESDNPTIPDDEEEEIVKPYWNFPIHTAKNSKYTK